MKLTFRRKVLGVVLVNVLIILLIIGLYWYDHPTHYQYNDRFVIGNTQDSIIERYGEFDKIFYEEGSQTEIHCAGYIVEGPSVGFLGTSLPKYYMIWFKGGKAINVAIQIGGWGG